MQILAFETSAKAVSVALVEDGALIGEYFQNSGQTHSRTLMQMAEDLLRNCDRTVADVDALACAAGPGSFTGVRIGAAAAKGFAWGRELPCYGVSTLEAMIRAAAWADGIYCAAMDARRNQVYTALFSLRQGVFTRLMEDSAISLEELKEKLLALPGEKFLVGDGASLCYNTLGNDVPALRLLPEHLRQQRASGVALLAWEMAQQGLSPSGADLIPNYLRLSQAERERLKQLSTETRERG